MQFWTVDVFSNRPFQGNAASVFWCDHPLKDELYERLALEVFQAETAFIELSSESLEKRHFKIRLFSPYGENKAAGHSIFAAAMVLWEEKEYPKNEPLYFEMNSSILKVTKNDQLISMTFSRSTVTPTVTPDRLFKALNTLPVSVSQCNDDLIVELHSEEELRALEPNFLKLATIENNRIIVTCEEQTQKYDFVSRVFSPRLGNDEEAANFSAYCDLASFWHTRTGKTSFKAKQLGYRSGMVLIDIHEDTVTLSGHALIISKGNLVVDLESDHDILR
ncbi:MAG: PhzF family phenazine biosynthesis protein [Proteobacteria bacterium]|nr:PhzF family phenazine biosynthesis protein [Pseudomonadota bacterium]